MNDSYFNRPSLWLEQVIYSLLTPRFANRLLAQAQQMETFQPALQRHQEDNHFPRVIGILALAVSLFVPACSTPVYSRGDGPTSELADNAVRYGSIATAGGVGFLAGKELGGNNTAGALGAGLGVVSAYGLNKYFDSKRKSAYQTGYTDGAAAARAEVVNQVWKTEAIDGLDAQKSTPILATYRKIYVPAHVINNVKLEGEYQTVEIVK